MSKNLKEKIDELKNILEKIDKNKENLKFRRYLRI